jgi:predicted ArsR family transcriptional regulator
MDALEAVGDPELREALRFVRSRRRSVSADELADDQAVHRNVARARLERLAEAGLLISHFERRTGRTGPGAGRPAKVYSPAPETTAIEFPERNYAELVGLLVDTLPQRGRKRRLRELGIELARPLARRARLMPTSDLRRGADRVCDALGRLGFQASVEEIRDDTVVISTPTCPLRPLVVARPELAEVDRGMWCGLLEAAVEGVHATEVCCETRDCLDDHASCRVVATLAQKRSRSRGATSAQN